MFVTSLSTLSHFLVAPVSNARLQLKTWVGVGKKRGLLRQRPQPKHVASCGGTSTACQATCDRLRETNLACRHDDGGFGRVSLARGCPSNRHRPQLYLARLMPCCRSFSCRALGVHFMTPSSSFSLDRVVLQQRMACKRSCVCCTQLPWTYASRALLCKHHYAKW